MANWTAAQAQPILKQHYTDQRVLNMVYKNRPLLAMISKMEDFGGDVLKLPLIYGDPQNRSATFSFAAAGTTNPLTNAFLLSRVSDYSVYSVSNEAILASQGNENAFLETLTVAIDGSINALAISQAQALYGTGFGNIGTVPTATASTTLTLGDPNDVVNFAVGQNLVFSPTAGASVLSSAGAILTVVAVDRDAGTLTMNANVNTVAVSGDFIFVQGDRQNSATPTAIKMSGLNAWIPTTAPTSTPFFNVDRSADVTRLAGQRKVYTGVPMQEAVTNAAALVAREGGAPDYLFCDFSKYAQLENSLGAKVQYIDLKVNPEIAFRGIRINGPKGEINVVPDPFCPSGQFFMLQMDTWKLYTLGKNLRIFDTDGLSMLRQSTEDGLTGRAYYYGQLGCRGPGFNLNGTW